MTDVIYYLAEGSAEEPAGLPLTGKISPLLPYTYDVFWSLVCFIVILLVFWKLVLPKFQEVLNEREIRITGGIQRAEAAQAEAKAALEKYNAQLADARQEANKIREDARAKGEEIKAARREEAEAEYKRIVDAGDKQLQAQREQVIAELRKDMGSNSIALAERLLGDQLDESVKRSGTIDRFLDELDNVAPAGK